MDNTTRLPDILAGRRSLAPYPIDKVRRAGNITTQIVGEIERIDSREHGFALAAAGRLGEATQNEFFRLMGKTPFAMLEVGALFQDSRDGDVFPSQAPLPDDPAVLSRHIKSLGYFLKAEGVGICELPQWAVYSHNSQGDPIECKHKYAIVILSDWDYETMDGSTGHDWISGIESGLSYNNSAQIAVTMASYIRRLGFPGRAHIQSMGPQYDVIVTPLIVLAGLGELSRAGWALNPFLGGRFKASVVTTDLPLQPDRPIDVGLQAFCRTCKKCAETCPSKAISMADEKVEHNGYLRYPFNMERCTKYRISNQNGTGCGMCVKSCPWNKPRGWTHDLTRWAIQTIPFVDPWLVSLDTFFGYGKQNSAWKWWFDYETRDEEIQLARHSSDNTLWQK